MLEEFTMNTMEMVMMVCFGLPLVLLVCAFVILATWLKVCEAQPESAHGKA